VPAPVPRRVVPAPLPTLDTEALGARIDKCFADAERLVGKAEQDADRAARALVRNDITAALRAMDRRIAIAGSGHVIPASGIFARLKLRVVRWRLARRHRRLIAKLDRSLARRDTQMADHSSAALLAVLTERISRLEAGAVTPAAIADALELAARTRGDYEAYVSRLVEMRDAARAEVAVWRANVVKANEADRADLATDAEQRVTEWERREREAASAVNRCSAGRLRLADAISQLQALGARVIVRS